MNTDDLRHVLADDSAHQPAVSPDFAAGVQRRVRRRRVQAAVAITPLVALGAVGVALARPGAAPDATLATAAIGADAGTTVPGTAPAAPATTALTPVPGGGETTTSVPDAATAPDPAAAPAPEGGDCGTVTMDGSIAAPRSTPDLAPLTCFLTAFNAHQAATVTVVTTVTGAGSTTSRIATSTDHVMTVTADGTITTKLPPFAFGGEGGVVSGDPGASQECGTFNVSQSAAQVPSTPTEAFTGGPVACFGQAILHGSPARMTVVIEGDLGGAVTSMLELSGDRSFTVTTSGTLTQQAPAQMQVPEDVIAAIPAAGTSLQGLPGLGGSWGGGIGHK